MDGFQYVNGVLQFVPTAEGYYDFTKSRYVYNYTDHLGNVRISFYKDGSTAAILEENNYYPFGLKHEGYNPYAGNPAYQYKYNGKELQENGMYDYGARFYIPEIGRWGVVVPLAEVSGDLYGYVLNNPIAFNDPSGMIGESTHTDRFGNVVKVYDDEDNGVYRHSGDSKQTLQELEEKWTLENTSGGGVCYSPMFGPKLS